MFTVLMWEDKMIADIGDIAALYNRDPAKEHAPGTHRVEVMLNGHAKSLGEFALTDR